MTEHDPGKLAIAGRADAVARTTAATPFERLSALCAILAAAVGLLYAVAFIVLRNSLLSGLALMLGGLLTTAVMVALYERLRQADPAFALWALLLGTVGTLGTALHGGYDLANALQPPDVLPSLPSEVDPRGLSTFGLTGLAIVAIAWLIGRSGQFPRGLGYLGYLLAILTFTLYLGRLIVLDPANPAIAVPALLTGFVVNPAWYAWLGVVLWRGPGGQS